MAGGLGVAGWVHIERLEQPGKNRAEGRALPFPRTFGLTLPCDPSIFVTCLIDLVSSVRSSSVYRGLIEIRTTQRSSKATFSNSSDSKVKVKVKGPNMCYIFEKHGIQGYRI